MLYVEICMSTYYQGKYYRVWSFTWLWSIAVGSKGQRPLCLNALFMIVGVPACSTQFFHTFGKNVFVMQALADLMPDVTQISLNFFFR